MAKRTKAVSADPATDAPGEKRRVTIYLSDPAAERLAVHGARHRLRPSQVVEELILKGLPGYVVQVRGPKGPPAPE